MTLTPTLVTNKTQLDPISDQISQMLASDDYRRNMHGEYTDFQIFNSEDTWNGECYIFYGSNVPVGILRPRFERSDRLVTTLRPYVFPAHRGHGYGRYMIAWAINNYARRGFRRLQTTVYATNEASLAINESLLIREGVIREGVCVDGQYVDIHKFGILLRYFVEPGLLVEDHHRRLKYEKIKVMVGEILASV